MLDIVVNSLYTNKDVFLREVCMRPFTTWICQFCLVSIIYLTLPLSFLSLY